MALTPGDEARLARLMKRMLAGDRGAEEAFCVMAYPIVYAKLGRTLNQSNPADAANETLAKLVRQARNHPIREFKWDQSRPFGPWFIRFIANAGHDYRRRNQSPPPMDPFTIAERIADHHDVADESTSEDELEIRRERQELARIAWDAVAELPEGERNAFKLWVRWEKTQEQIAEELDTAPGTVGSSISRACVKVRKRLTQEGFIFVGECSQGVRILSPNCLLDLENGRAGPKVRGDLRWRVNNGHCQLEPCGEARVARVYPPPASAFKQLRTDGLAKLPYAGAPIEGRSLTPDSVLAAKTRSGYFAKIEVIRRDEDVVLGWVTYIPWPPGSRVIVRLRAGLIVSCRSQPRPTDQTKDGDAE